MSCAIFLRRSRARKAPYPVGKAMNDAAADRSRRYLHKLRMPARAALAVCVRAPQSRSERGDWRLSGSSDPALGPILPGAVMIRSWLSLFAQRTFCCCFCGFRSCRWGFLRGGGFCKGKRTAQIAEQQNACQQKCQPPFPEFHKMIRHNCLLYYNCIIGHRSCCLCGFGRVCPETRGEDLDRHT